MFDMYSFPTDNQVTLFFLSVGFGFLLGIYYDILRIIRILTTKGKVALVGFDVFFALSCALLTYIYLLAVNKGSVRAYLILGELLGGFFYYVSFGIAVIRISDRIIRFLKHGFSLFWIYISAPFVKLFRYLGKKTAKIKVFMRKNEKKQQKNLKKLLQIAKASVYNSNGVFSRQKKDGSGLHK